MNFVFKPHAGPQTRFMEFPGRYALFGGAAGPGKTTTMIYDPFRQILGEHRRVERGEIQRSVGHAILFRRTMPELREILRRVHVAFKKIDPGAKWLGETKTYTFSCGYEYTFGHMEEAGDWIKYYGNEYTWLGFDELCTFEEEQYDQLDTRVRTADRVLQKQLSVRATTNPVGVGLEWVRRRFYEIAPPNTTVTLRIRTPITKPDGSKGETIVERQQVFIPGKLSDNPSVDEADYAATLTTKSAATRKALLEGDWYAPLESWIANWWEAKVHVCKSFKVKRDNPSKFRSCRFKTSWPNLASVQWWIVDEHGNLTCYRSLTLEGHTSEMLAGRIREEEEALDAGEWDVHRGCSKLTGPLDGDCWPEPGQNGPSVAETMAAFGVYWFRADKETTVNAMADQMRMRLTKRSPHPTLKDAKGKPQKIIPGIRWFDTCWNEVRDNRGRKVRTGPVLTIPVLPSDPGDMDIPHVDIKKTNPHDWLSAAFACMSRPVTPGKDVGDGDKYEDEQAHRRRHEAPKRKYGRMGAGGW